MSKTLIGSFYGDIANSVSSLGWNAMQLGAKLKDAKDNADIERESERIKQSANEFLKSLQFDRDHEGYGDKAKEWYEKAVSSLDEPDNTMSKRAKKQFKETYLPAMKEQVYGQIPALQNIAIMAELKVDTERFADMIASDDNLSIDEAVHQYYLKLKGFGDQGLLNSGTIQKMVDDFRYETAPVKALQTLQKEYKANVINDKYNFSQQIAVVGGEAGLDASQQEALRKAAISFQTEWDKQLDLQFTEQKNVLLGDIAEAKDNKDFFALEIVDAMLDQVPARHKLELYKVKNTAMDNNDGLIKEELTRVVNNRQVPTEDNWGLLSYVANPYTRDEMTKDLAFAHGNAMISDGASLTEARRAIDSLPGLSPGVREKAKAKLTKDILDREGDVEKVAKDMLSSAGYKAPTASKVSEVAYAGTVATISKDVPPIDASQLVRKDEYIEEQQEAVTQAVLESQELDDLIANEGLEEEDREALAAEIADDIVSNQVQEARDNADEETKKAVTGAVQPMPQPTSGFTFKVVPFQIDWEGGPLFTSKDESTLPSTQDQGYSQASWVDQYLAKHAERAEETRASREEWDERLEAQAQEDINKFSSSGVEAPVEPVRVTQDMTQEEILTNMLERIRAGEGRYISTEELAFIKDDAIRSEINDTASISDALNIDSPIALGIVDDLRRNMSIPSEVLKTVVREFVDAGAIKASTAKKKGLVEHYPWADNPKFKDLYDRIDETAAMIYPTIEGTVSNLDQGDLKELLTNVATNAISMNPDLIGKDYGRLLDHLTAVATAKKAKALSNKMSNIANQMSGSNVTKLIDNLGDSTTKTFMQDVEEGRYELWINPAKVQAPEVRLSLANGKEAVLDAVSRQFTSESWDYLSKNGNEWQRLQVMANAAFVLLGDVQSKALKGSLGITASDAKLIGNKWAFQDPVNPDMWFVYDKTSINGQDIGWGIVRGDAEGLTGMIRLRDYVDPKLIYRNEELAKMIADPLFGRAQTKAEAHRLTSPLGMGGLGISPVKNQEKLDAKYYGVLQEYEDTSAKIKEITDDIMAYRVNLMGLTYDQIRTRL